MNKQNRTFLLIGVVLLTASLLFPWVKLDSMATRQANLDQVAELLARIELSEGLAEQFAHYRLRPGMSSAELWTVSSTGPRERNFAALQDRQYLFVWHLLWFDVAWLSRFALLFLIGWYAVALFFLLSQRPPSDEPMSLMGDPYAQEDEDLPRRKFKTPPLIGSAVLMLLFFRLPYWDSLGHTGDWHMALLDVLSGAKVALAPRLLAPAGLFFLMLSGVANFINRRASRRKSPMVKFNIDGE